MLIDSGTKKKIGALFVVSLLAISLTVVVGSLGSLIDKDGDGVFNWSDNCPSIVNENQADNDIRDGLDGGNSCDSDDDNDGILDEDDDFPLDSTEYVDTDNDGVGDNADIDDDGDGFMDDNDLFPLDANEALDSDGDGVGDNADIDDDNDSWLDLEESYCHTISTDANSIPVDTDMDRLCDIIDEDDDNDGYLDLDEIIYCDVWSNPLDSDSVPIDDDGDLICNLIDDDDDNDGILDIDDIYGCTNNSAENYNPEATKEDETCIFWELTAAEDVDAVFVTSEWTPIIANLNAGDMCDALLSSMTKTDTREEQVDFTRGYYTSSIGVIGANGSEVISDASELNAAGTVVAVQATTSADFWAEENLQDATILAYQDFSSVIQAINNGDAHYAMGDAPVLAAVGTLMVTFSEETFGIAVAEEGSDLLLDALNVAITAIIGSGEYDLIFGASFDGTVVLTDDTTADTATSYPMATEGSRLAHVLETGQLKLCSDTTYPPFESMDADGNVVGFSADLAHAIVDEMAAHYMGVSNPMFIPPPHIIKIGFLNDATGPLSVYADAFTFAAEAALATLNTLNDEYSFEIVEVDSACDGTAAATAAQVLVDAGVVAVAGAACSIASMHANAVLTAAGIPMVSYASTSPVLSDATAHPDFFRVVPSDTLQGGAMADMVAASGVTSPALIHMTNAYGGSLADAFEDSWIDNGNTLCAKLGYEDTATDFSAAVQGVMDAGCDSVVLASYSADGAMIIETMAVMGAGIPVFGADGIAGESALEDYTNPAAANGVQVTKPRDAVGSGDFAFTCAVNVVCSSGIYTLEAYDAIMMIGHAAMMEDGANMAAHIDMVGVDYNGESGVITFLDNGDIPGAGYDICTFNHVPTFGDYFNCDKMWTVNEGVEAVPFMGTTVKIGFLIDATGPIAVYAGGFVAASQIALGILNIIGWTNMFQFELVYADSGCDGTMAATAAQTLVDAGVVGVVGAACSGASMGANAVLSAAGIPMISYASSSPALSDDTAYPDFFRVVPSDALQGQALSAVVQADMPANGTVGLIHMTNDYGAVLADSFSADFTAAGHNLCTTIGYQETTTDFSAAVQAMIDNGCTSAVLVSYATDGGMILDEMALQGWSGQVYGSDGIAEEGLAEDMDSSVDGVIAVTVQETDANSLAYFFANLCAQSVDCADGIYTAEAFDSVVVMGLSAFAHTLHPGATLSQIIMASGQGWLGASGAFSFLANGDVPGAGYCVGDFTEDTDGVSFDCNRSWTLVEGLSS